MPLLTYLGPSGRVLDRETGLTWHQGDTHQVDADTARRLVPTVETKWGHRWLVEEAPPPPVETEAEATAAEAETEAIPAEEN